MVSGAAVGPGQGPIYDGAHAGAAGAQGCTIF